MSARGLAATLLLASLAHADTAALDDPLLPTPPMDRFVTNRPRLFVNAKSLSTVTQVTVRAHGAWLNDMREHLSSVTAKTNQKSGDYGVESAAAAFLFLCNRTPARLSIATGLLKRSVAYYRDCDRNKRPVSHYSTTRIHAITAYDWLYENLPPEQRVRLGRDLIAHVAHRVLDRPVRGDNQSDHRSGFYGEISLPWYVGIATHGSGIDETQSAAAIAFGYDQQIRMLRHRRSLAGDDGGGATATLGYVLGADPWAEWNFFHTMESAFGLNVATNWPHVALLPNYVLWNRLPGNREFGTGDAFHTLNEMPDEHLDTHLAQIRHFFGKSHPEQAALAAWLQKQYGRSAHTPAWPLTPFFLIRIGHAPPPRCPPPDLPLARHFEGMGQVFMRSGWGDNDTYALFTAGGRGARHKHFDENAFAIYHRGFLALDTGTRPEPGSHLFQYYCRTVAHNAILIRMEGEVLPWYWGTPAPGEADVPIANDGGMCSQTGAVIRAFHTTPAFTYIASDATACYHPGKSRLSLRQFLHIQPNIFVIFDRITTVRPEYRKTWLLHTADEPRIEDRMFMAEQGEGRIVCRTLLPTHAVLSKIGGPGKEFWSDGRNWSLPANVRHPIRQTELMGAWRIEVSPIDAELDDCFLHLIEVGDIGRTNMAHAELVHEVNRAGIRVDCGDTVWTVLFHTAGAPGAELVIVSESGETLIPLPNVVQPQSGLARIDSGSEKGE